MSPWSSAPTAPKGRICSPTVPKGPTSIDSMSLSALLNHRPGLADRNQPTGTWATTPRPGMTVPNMERPCTRPESGTGADGVLGEDAWSPVQEDLLAKAVLPEEAGVVALGVDRGTP